MSGARRPVQPPEVFFHNTLLNVIGRLCTMAVAFLLTPFVLHALGTDAFGLWALAYALISMPFLLDLGMNAAVQKYTAAAFVGGREGAIAALVRGAVLLQLVMWGAVALAAWIWRAELAPRLAPSSSLVPSVEVLVWCVPALIGPAAAMWCLDGALAGLRRMDVSNAAKVAAAVLTGVLSIVFLNLGLGLPGLLLANAAGIALGFGAELAALWRSLHHAQPTGDTTASMLAQVTRYGLSAQATNLLLLATTQLDKLVLGIMVGIGAVTAYELGWRLLGFAQTVPMMLLSVIAPAASELDAHGDRAALRTLYWTGSRLLAAVYVPLVGLLVAVAPLVITAWVGSGFDSSVTVVRLLAVAAGLNLATGMGTTVARGIGRPTWETAYVGGAVALRVPLGLALVASGLGLDGVLWANVTATAITSALFIVGIHRQLGLRFAPLFSQVLARPILATALAMLVSSRIGWSAAVLPSEFSGRSATLGQLGWVSVVFLAVYVVAVVSLGHFTAGERSFVRQYLPRRRTAAPGGVPS